MNKVLDHTITLGISNESIALVEVEKKKNGINISQFASIDLPSGIIEDHCLLIDADAFKERLTQLIHSKGLQIKGRHVILSFSESKIFSHHIEVPKSHLFDEPYLRQLAADFIPIDLGGAITDYQWVGSTKKAEKVNFVAIQNGVLQPIIEAVAEIGLKVIFVDIRQQSLLRLCRFAQKGTSDFCFLDLGAYESFISGQDQAGQVHMAHLDLAGGQLITEIKKEKKSSLPEAHRILFDSKKVASSLSVKKAFQLLVKQVKDFTSKVNISKGSQVKTIFLMGPYSHVPGLITFLKKSLPDIELKDPLELFVIQNGDLFNYPQLMGSALLSVLPFDLTKEINLSPEDKKVSLQYYLLTPLVKKFLVVSTILLSLLSLASGFRVANRYIAYRVSENEVQTSLEKSQSPYLLNRAKQTQEKTTIQNQVNRLINTNIPFYNLLERLNSYNGRSVQMTSINFALGQNPVSEKVRLRAKVASRADTEKLVNRLEADSFFEKIISPLANLTGKGERFVNIDIQFNTTTFIEGVLSQNKNSSNQ